MGFLLSGGTKPHQSPYVNFIAAAHVCYTWNASCKTIFFDWGGNKEFFKRVEGLHVRRATHVLRERHRQKIRSLFDIPCRCIRFPSTILTPDKNKCGPFCTVFPSYSLIWICYIREDINEKKTFSFGHCPNHLNPPHDPNSGNLVLFFRTSKTTF